MSAQQTCADEASDCATCRLARPQLANRPMRRLQQPFKQGDWPFRPLTRPEVPSVDNFKDDEHKDWLQNPIDNFILAKLAAAKLQPNVRADKCTLLRRVTFDLTGLPPTPAEQAAFLADSSPDAYAKVVDRLLASPRYGERWAQHWLDVVRYSETEGFKKDGLRPDAYQYRDYVIRAFNSDLPYDRFVRQQLAGDELEPNNPDALIATGLIRLYPEDINASNLVQQRQEILDDVTENTGLAFLGLTIGCARCHDHKFDDIKQTDYYRLQACFAAILPARRRLDRSPRTEGRVSRARWSQWEKATKPFATPIDTELADEREAAMQDAISAYDPQTLAAIKTPARKTLLLPRAARRRSRRMDRLPHRPRLSPLPAGRTQSFTTSRWKSWRSTTTSSPSRSPPR